MVAGRLGELHRARPQLEAKAPGELEAAVRLLLDKNWGFRLHATYGETIASDLEVFTKIAGDGGFPRGVRWFFDHAETVSDESLERIADLGGAVSIQNRMMFQGRAFVDRYGAALAETAPPVVKMLDRGLTVGRGPTLQESRVTTPGSRSSGWCEDVTLADSYSHRSPTESIARPRWRSTPREGPPSPVRPT